MSQQTQPRPLRAPPRHAPLAAVCALCLLFPRSGPGVGAARLSQCGRVCGLRAVLPASLGEASAWPICWVHSRVALSVCLYMSTACLGLVGEPQKQGSWSPVLDVGRKSPVASGADRSACPLAGLLCPDLTSTFVTGIRFL